ncbi:MAG: NAD(P)-dependent oxidoreductase [Clostridium sp.]|nr:NAD(P)-dependent oxidoreductase [Clostridium sp.]
MPTNNKKDICTGRIDYSSIALLSKKLRVGVIGAGKGGVIKARHFLNQNSQVFILTKDKISSEGIEKATIINKEYDRSFILDKHIIIIAVKDENLRNKIKEHCEEICKIYIDASNFKEGMGVLPVQRESKNLVFTLNTKGGNPKASVFISNKIKEELKKYDDFVEFTTIVRNQLKENNKLKDEVLNFIFNDDFIFFFNKGKGSIILKMFYDKN